MKYPSEFLGRCATCLDNAYLDREPCKHGYGNGMPSGHDRCLIELAREDFDKTRANAKQEERK